MTEVKKSITINVPTKLLDKETHEGKPYTTKEGVEKKPVLRGVTLNIGTTDAPKWGKFSVRDTAIIPMTNYTTKQPVAGMSTVFLEPDIEYTFTTREATGKQIADKNGKMVNEWVNKPEKMTGAAIKDAVKAARSAFVHSAKEAGEKNDKTVWVSVSEKLVDEETHEGKPYTTKEGVEKKPVLRTVSLNLGTIEEPKWGTISVRDSSIKDATNFKTGEKIEGVKRFPLDAAVEYTFTTREATGKQIADKNGKMVNEWINKPEKMTGAAIADALKTSRETYKHSLGQLVDKKVEAAVDAPKADAPKKAVEAPGK